MSAYASEADLDAAFGQAQVDLVSIDDRSQVRDHDKIAQALALATAQINSYVNRRYPLPLAPTAEGALQLKQLCCDIAFARIATSADRMTEIIGKRADAALAMLKDIAAGRADIAIADGSAPGSTATPAVSNNEPVIIAPDRIFSRGSLRGLP